MEPSWYEELTKPSSPGSMAKVPSSLVRPFPKSRLVSTHVSTRLGLWGLHTFVKCLRKLQCVDKLRIESGCHFYSHTAEKEPHIHETEVPLLVPWRLVLCHEASDDGISCRTYVDHVDDELRRWLCDTEKDKVKLVQCAKNEHDA